MPNRIQNAPLKRRPISRELRFSVPSSPPLSRSVMQGYNGLMPKQYEYIEGILLVYWHLLPKGFICLSYVSPVGTTDIIEAQRTS